MFVCVVLPGVSVERWRLEGSAFVPSFNCFVHKLPITMNSHPTVMAAIFLVQSDVASMQMATADMTCFMRFISKRKRQLFINGDKQFSHEIY